MLLNVVKYRFKYHRYVSYLFLWDKAADQSAFSPLIVILQDVEYWAISNSLKRREIRKYHFSKTSRYVTSIFYFLNNNKM